MSFVPLFFLSPFSLCLPSLLSSFPFSFFLASFSLSPFLLLSVGCLPWIVLTFAGSLFFPFILSPQHVLLFSVWVLSHFSHVRLVVTPWTVAQQVPLSMRFSRQQCWSGLLFTIYMAGSEHLPSPSFLHNFLPSIFNLVLRDCRTAELSFIPSNI